ncbi:MAG TPA: NADP-dependent oxidoreductase [Jatrophihabitantaceae bacterium]|jgi:NADPH:quinone reductase-like Zn-dependent oxidoreductase
MRAVVVSKFGSLDLIEVPTSEPGPAQVRIEVAAAAVNPVDVLTRDGVVPIDAEQLPVGLGWDVAGRVDAVGAGVEQFAVGDVVVGLEDQLVKKLGPYADFVVLDAAAVAPAPRTVDAIAASTLPLNAVTAAQSLDLIDLAPGQTLLVTGAAGAVGGFVVELATARGLHVVGLAGAGDEQAVRGWGARTFVPRSDDPAGAVRAIFPDGVDGVIDPAHLRESVLGAVRDGGAYVNLAPSLGPAPAERAIRRLDQFAHHDGALLAELGRLVDAGRLTLRVAQTFPLDEAPAALDLAGKGGLRGRVVIVP